MSAVSLAWVASIKVGNQTAKQLLQFYASHNFHKPGFEFSNEVLAGQLEVTERSIINAHNLLVDKKLIIREKRYHESGRELVSVTYLNIPNDFIREFEDRFYKKQLPTNSVDNSKGEGERRSSLGVNVVQGEGERMTPLNNKRNNKNNNKELYCSSGDEPQSSPSVEYTFFDQFWALYPRKQKKLAAQKAWQKMRGEEHAEEIIKNIKHRLQFEWLHKDKEFIPLPASYLNGERWKDEVIQKASSKEGTKFNPVAYVMDSIRQDNFI